MEDKLLTNNSARPVSRYLFIDILRIIACFFVIVNHTNSIIFMKETPENFTWWLSLTYFFMSKVAVPIFVMISGYTLLYKCDTYKKSLSRIFRIIVVLILFSFMYYFCRFLTGSIPKIDILDFLGSIYNKPITNAYWYLYLYLGILVMLPFIQKFVTALSKKDILIFISIYLMFYSVYPVVIHYFPFLEVNKNFRIDLFFSYLGLLLIGYYFKKYAEFKKKYLIISVVVYALTLLFNVLMTWREYTVLNGANYTFLDNREFFPIVFQGVALFYIIMYLLRNAKNYKLFSTIGACSFGIYLFSDLFVSMFLDKLGVLTNLGIPEFIAMIIIEIAIFVISLVFTYLIRLVPIAKKFI